MTAIEAAQLLDTRGRRNNRTIPDRQCEQCAAVFRPWRASARFCSHRCHGISQRLSAECLQARAQAAAQARARDVTPAQAARLLGVSRRTVERWIEEGRLSVPIDRQALLDNPPRPRQRGPQRNPESKRYWEGRHTYRPREEQA